MGVPLTALLRHIVTGCWGKLSPNIKLLVAAKYIFVRPGEPNTFDSFEVDGTVHLPSATSPYMSFFFFFFFFFIIFIIKDHHHETEDLPLHYPHHMFSPENTMDARQITCIWQTVKASCRGWVSTIWYHKPDNSILNSKHLKWHFWTCSFCKTLSFISKRKILKKIKILPNSELSLLYKCENAANKWTACSGLCLKEVKIVAKFHNKICGGFWHFLGQSWVNFAESKAWSLFSKSDNLKSLLPKGKVLQRKKSSWYISKSTMVLKPKRLRRLKIGSSIFWEQLQFFWSQTHVCNLSVIH